MVTVVLGDVFVTSNSRHPGSGKAGPSADCIADVTTMDKLAEKDQSPLLHLTLKIC